MEESRFQSFKKKFYKWSFFKKLLLFFLIASAVSGVVLFCVLFVLARNLPTREQILNREISQSTKIYDRSGEKILYEISAGGKRTVLPLEEIPPFIKDATIAMEDENFYSGGPVDWKAIIRALLADIRHGEIVQGGSTITQQLAKNAFLTPEQTITRKLKELLLAVRLDKEYSKDQILALYLNEIPYGPTSYGVDAASRTYFDKPLKDLSIAQMAVLVSLPKAPSYYSPWGSHVDRLMARKELVLKKMNSLGKISDADLQTALHEEIKFQTPQNANGNIAMHFVMAVQEYLVERYGEEMVRNGGLRVITTLDTDLQKAAEDAVFKGVERNEKLYGGKNAALLAEDSNTGQILAMVGSKDYFDVDNQGNFNVATQGLRQPGSALKPFVYLESFKKGFTPDTVLFDLPTEFSTNSECPSIPNLDDENPKCFHPGNYDGKFRGPVSVRTALSESINIPAVKTLYIVGLNNAISTMHRFGLSTISDPKQYGLSLVLGGGAVKLIDLVKAYSVLAEDGTLREQSMILEVKNSKGEVLESFKDHSEQVVDSKYTRLINNVLSDVNARAPLFQASLPLTVFPEYDVALKTGTSNDYHDAWAMGYTPTLVVGVWAGNNDNSAMHKQGSSILAAVPIWSEFMKTAVQKQPKEAFVKPDQITPEKPILRGEYVVNGQIHSILYWIDKNDPTGDVPQDPYRDPQFKNWEASVNLWAGVHPPSPGEPPPTSSSTTPTPNQPPMIQIQKPQIGASFTTSIDISASLSSLSPIKSIRVIWNGETIQGFTGNFGTSYQFSTTLAPANSEAQNLLEIEAVNQEGISGRIGTLVHKK